jgi:hypothetical protein
VVKTAGHKLLCYTEEAFSKTGRQDFLAEFDFVLESKYKPGRTNQVADALSRKAELLALKGEELAAICFVEAFFVARLFTCSTTDD